MPVSTDAPERGGVIGMLIDSWRHTIIDSRGAKRATIRANATLFFQREPIDRIRLYRKNPLGQNISESQRFLKKPKLLVKSASKGLEIDLPDVGKLAQMRGRLSGAEPSQYYHVECRLAQWRSATVGPER